MSNPSPGYLTTLFENGAFVGGVMITNDRGIPTDFQYTDPVTPTKVQRIIYGSVLEQYIRNHVIIGAITKSITNQPSFYIVSPHQLFDMEEAMGGIPLVSVAPTKFASLGEQGKVTRSKDNECLLQGWRDPNPMRILFGKLPVDRQEFIIKDLIHLARHMDVVEPLDRLEKALKTLCLDKAQD